MPVILVTEEAEIRRIMVQETNSSRDSIENTQHKKGLVEWLKW
jgi:hypothetical protein